MKRIINALVASMLLGSCGVQPEPVDQAQQALVSPESESRPGTPDPTTEHGGAWGDCEATVNCKPGKPACTISCAGNSACQWRYQPGGFIQCHSFYPPPYGEILYKETCEEKLKSPDCF